MQKVLIVETAGDGIRNDIVMRYQHDSNQVHIAFQQQLHGTHPVMFTKDTDNIHQLSTHYVDNGDFPKYRTVLHALADGWRLLAPPTTSKDSNGLFYSWWLVKE